MPRFCRQGNVPNLIVDRDDSDDDDGFIAKEEEPQEQPEPDEVRVGRAALSFKRFASEF